MPEQIPTPEDQMMQWITSKWIVKPIHIAAELGIADILSDGPLSIDDLAEKTGTHAPSLFRLLRALSSVGIFSELNERAFGLTPLAECLRSDAMRPMARMFLSGWHDKAWGSLSYTVKTGYPGFDHAFGKPAFEWLEENRQARAIFDQGQGLKAAEFGKTVSEAYDFSGFNTICDVGGGQGTFLVHLLANHPNINGIIADMQGVKLSAEKALSKANLSDHCKIVTYDFLKEAPPVCDGYFLVNVLHDWEDMTCCRILENISKSMNTDTRVWIVEYILEPGPGFSIAKLLDIEVLVMGGGRERTLEEYEALLGSSGMALLNVIPTSQGPALLECALG